MIDYHARTPRLAWAALIAVGVIVVSEIMAALIGGTYWMVMIGVGVSFVIAIGFVLAFVLSVLMR
ncbi:hypothetical protein [Poriferisphaera corsica]|nr:hypothetical protein [Poriferisphaera corsica]